MRDAATGALRAFRLIAELGTFTRADDAAPEGRGAFRFLRPRVCRPIWGLRLPRKTRKVLKGF